MSISRVTLSSKDPLSLAVAATSATPHRIDLRQFDVGANAMKKLLAFKASERKDDPSRYQGIHGPYEVLTIHETGRLPDDYYAEGDDIPWGLRVAESRSNILYQSVSGMLDKYPEYAAAYLGLALARSLADEDYVTELGQLNEDWNKFIERASLPMGHQHRAMRTTYSGVSCAACSLLTALAVSDKGMGEIFNDLLGLKPEERVEALTVKGLMPLLNVTIDQVVIDGAVGMSKIIQR
ncbi:MAG: hypothetical protein FJX22_01370 [Alphaproteobacteria bacterium]|nr:hypothetical protein [Alphaproteobacteria bacterium]